MMETLCAHENRKCVLNGFGEQPVVEVLRDTGNFAREVTHLMIIYVMEGKADVSFGTVSRYRLSVGDFMLFPPGTRLSVQPSEKPAAMIALTIRNRIVLCDKHTFGHIWRDIDTAGLRHSHLEANRMVKAYMDLLAENVAGPLNCFRFMETKILELFHYLRAYYQPEELARFTLPLVSPNSQFMYFIWNSYRKVRNVNQFARMANCSLSAFKVKFKNVTGMAPSQWLAQQKAQNVYHEIASGEKSLKEISEEYHFSSVSHLGTFCRKNFGQSPGNLKPGAGKGKKRPD